MIFQNLKESNKLKKKTITTKNEKKKANPKMQTKKIQMKLV